MKKVLMFDTDSLEVKGIFEVTNEQYELLQYLRGNNMLPYDWTYYDIGETDNVSKWVQDNLTKYGIK